MAGLKLPSISRASGGRSKLLQNAYKPLIVIGCIVTALVTTWSDKGRTSFDGFLYDVIVAQRAILQPVKPDRPKPVAVVAMDVRSLKAPELAAYPRVFFAPVWAKLLDGLYAAGATASGFDIIFAWSAAQISPGLETPFLTALAKYRDKTVIGRTGFIPPVMPFFYAIRGGNDPTAVSFLELEPDSDGINRRVPTQIGTREGIRPSLVGGLLKRVEGPDFEQRDVLVAPRAPMEVQIPTYSMIDVLRCAESDPELMKKVFADKVVFFGTTLPDEDRKTAPDRFIISVNDEQPDIPEPTSCQLEPSIRSAYSSRTIPGVHVHAQAMEQILNHDEPTVPSLFWMMLMSGIVAGGIATLGLALSVPRALAVTGLSEIGLYGGSSAAFLGNIYVPISMVMIQAALAMFVAYMARYVLEERKRLRIQKAFGTYLAPDIVARLADDDSGLKLGGQFRELTVLFADLSGFTMLSTKLKADELMQTTNRYLTELVGSVDGTDGYVDKFIGDAVMAYWGAPAPDDLHALHGVVAALEAVRRVEDLYNADSEAGLNGFKVKIGLNTGQAVVGNVGTSGRMNYTAVGEAVNIAARLESVPSDYNCTVIIGPQTAEQVKDYVLFHEVDWIRVKGRAKPLEIFRPIGTFETVGDVERKFVADYAVALDLFRKMKFAEAADLWRAQVVEFPAKLAGPAAAMIERAESYIEVPPPDDWDGVWVKPTK